MLKENWYYFVNGLVSNYGYDMDKTVKNGKNK